MGSRGRVIALAAATAALGAAGTIPGAGAATKAPEKAEVSVTDFSFGPETVKVAKGGKVVWKFKEGSHNVDGKGFESPILSSGKYGHRFKKVGTFAYRCTLHQPNMDGVVKVVK